jgi:hypothetical protein
MTLISIDQYNCEASPTYIQYKADHSSYDASVAKCTMRSDAKASNASVMNYTVSTTKNELNISACSIPKVVKNYSVEEWSNQLAWEYDKLIEKEAYGTLSEADSHRMDSLEIIRNSSHPSRSANAVLNDYSKSKAIDDMIVALNNYVNVFNPQNP